MISLKLEYASHWVKNWSALFRVEGHFSQIIDSEKPRVKECSFRNGRPTLIRVKRLHLYLFPFD